MIYIQDIGVASPLYDFCRMLGISDIYKLPIHLVPWTVPYPINVPWPVIEYGSGIDNRRKMGYIIVQPGGRTKLFLYDEEDSIIITLDNIKDLAEVHSMGPRLLFSSPNRAIKLPGTDSIATLVPFNNEEEESQHPLERFYHAPTDSFRCFDPISKEYRIVKHAWVQENVLPMCSKVLIQAWTAPCMQKLRDHIGSSQQQQQRLYVMGRIVPPRECFFNNNDHGIWVAVEVRHTVGNLKGMHNADMITLKIDPEHLRTFDPSQYRSHKQLPKGIIEYTDASHRKKRRREEDEDDDDDDNEMVVATFIYANKVSSLCVVVRLQINQPHFFLLLVWHSLTYGVYCSRGSWQEPFSQFGQLPNEILALLLKNPQRWIHRHILQLST
jgi:hypothetical protein